MPKVLLVTNNTSADALDGAYTLERWLGREGIDIVWASSDENNNEVDLDEVILAVSLGGDGTIIRTAHIVMGEHIPILGLSFGHLGFLTGAPATGIIKSVGMALADELHQSRRSTMQIDVEFEDGTEETYVALNELALTRGSMGKMIECDVAVNGGSFDAIRGDGFVVSTATGSTGYALSAGGPIVSPDFNGLVCVPIAPHTINSRAFLTSPSDVVELSVDLERFKEICMFADGQPVAADKVPLKCKCYHGEYDIILLDQNTDSFYESVSRVFYGGRQ